MDPFSTPWKHQKTVRFLRKGALGTIGLITYGNKKYFVGLLFIPFIFLPQNLELQNGQFHDAFQVKFYPYGALFVKRNQEPTIIRISLKLASVYIHTNSFSFFEIDFSIQDPAELRTIPCITDSKHEAGKIQCFSRKTNQRTHCYHCHPLISNGCFGQNN